MESLQRRHLANDSFSYSWLINDPSRKPISGSRRPSWETLDFDFGIGLQQPEPNILHADQLFSDGLLLPLHLLPPPPPVTERPSCSDGDNSDSAVHSRREKKWSWGSRRVIVLKYVMGFFKPLYRCGRRRVAQGKVGPETMSCPVSLSSTPRTSNAYSSMGLDVEDCIYEAVLHCKKSITVFTQEGH